jgi:thioredoxin 1
LSISQFLAGAALALVVAWLAYLAVIYRSSRAALGRSVAALADAIPGLGRAPEPALLYFYSEHCPPCRQTTPAIDALAAERPAIFKVDVTQAADLAKRLGVRVTPTLLVVRDGRVARVLLGARSRATIARALDSA